MQVKFQKENKTVGTLVIRKELALTPSAFITLKNNMNDQSDLKLQRVHWSRSGSVT